MAARKMTFTLPGSLAADFVKIVPARDRSKYVAEALAAKLAERERRFVRACEIANQDVDVLAIEREFDAIPDDTLERWTDAKAR